MARIFIAIRFNNEFKKSLAHIQEVLKERGVQGNYCSWGNLHMTLAFIGEHYDLSAIRRAVSEVEFEPFDLTLGNLGTFPTKAGVIWCGVKDGSAVTALANQLRERLAANGVAYSETDFYPHISLVQHPSACITDIVAPDASIRVEKIFVMKSERINGELVYSEIETKLVQPLNTDLKSFIEKKIIPLYAAFDKAHQEDHVRAVIAQSMALAPFYEVCTDMVYAIAAYHDLGLQEDRKTHHLVSGRIVRGDERLRNWFTEEQIELMAQAVEDHRASSDHEPRSIYGKIVAEADRLIDTNTIVRRTIQYGLKHYPELDREGHIQRALDHLNEKYAEGGYLKLWIPESSNAGRLRSLQNLIKDRARIRELVELIYNQEIQ